MSQQIDEPLDKTAHLDDLSRQFVRIIADLVAREIESILGRRPGLAPHKEEEGLDDLFALRQHLEALTRRTYYVPQVGNPDADDDTCVSNNSDQLLRQFEAAGLDPDAGLVCEVELTRFDPSQQAVLLPLLWRYILRHRDGNDCARLVSVGAAIRKYVALMPMEAMGELATLLESGHKAALPLELELEVAKMICRNFEVFPPAEPDTFPELAQKLWDMAQAYMHPRLLLRDKHSAVASLAVEAIVAMRSPLAESAWAAVNASPYRWFAELVSDDLDELQRCWNEKSSSAAVWLQELRDRVFSHA